MYAKHTRVADMVTFHDKVKLSNKEKLEQNKKHTGKEVSGKKIKPGWNQFCNAKRKKKLCVWGGMWGACVGVCVRR